MKVKTKPLSFVFNAYCYLVLGKTFLGGGAPSALSSA